VHKNVEIADTEYQSVILAQLDLQVGQTDLRVRHQITSSNAVAGSPGDNNLSLFLQKEKAIGRPIDR
jgi:hypothetical protein